jgi:hypothetical protein
LVAVAGAAALASTGCYKPNIPDGKLLCGPASACPDDYACVEGHCWRGGVVSGDAGNTDDGSPGDLDCTPLPECSATETAACAPACQTSCTCQEKCTISGSGVAICQKVAGGRKPRETCTVKNYGSPTQSDDCVPGSVCIRPDPTDGRGWCFAFCGSDAACDNARCVSRPIGPATAGSPMAKVCDVPFVECDPFTFAGCTTERPYCYLTPPDPSTGASRTVCEYLSGLGQIGEACSASRDCIPRYVCPSADGDPNRPGVGRCTPPCNAMNACNAIGSCQPYGSNYGYCN